MPHTRRLAATGARPPGRRDSRGPPAGAPPKTLYANWRAAAACIDFPTDLFFPPRGGDKRSEDHRASVARSVCALCPVRLACLTVALGAETPADADHHAETALSRPSQLAGIWGGTNERERRALRRQIAAGRPLADVVAEVPAPSAARHPSLRATEACG